MFFEQEDISLVHKKIEQGLIVLVSAENPIACTVFLSNGGAGISFKQARFQQEGQARIAYFKRTWVLL